MKTLPGIKIAVFFTLVFVVGLGVYAGTKNTKALNKKQKFIVGFGWSETDPCAPDPVAHSVADIELYLTGTGKANKYKLQHYVDGNPFGAPQGNLCLWTSNPPTTTNAISSAAAPQAGPSGTPAGAKTQSAGYAQFDSSTDADNFTDWVNSTSAVPSKSKGTKK
jgi:hypothetical protein